MDADQIIAVLLKWLSENQSTFSDVAWENLPKLATEIASADDELFPIAMIISQWCAENNLGDELRRSVREVTPGKPLPSTLEPLENLTKTIPDIIMDAYKKAQKPGAITTADTSNESR
ncbi:hypothetical protein QUB68_24245 [Microcoleus sp. A006_D1]|uniref:hypothetical protein n=1 Tax=Microcoleus sp. A006_D1 TaxID=3055267 RepID=UPI002FD2D0ED